MKVIAIYLKLAILNHRFYSNYGVIMKKYKLAIVLCYIIVATSSIYGREDGPPTDKESDRTPCLLSSGATKEYVEKEVEKATNK